MNGELEIQEDMAFQHMSWRVQRIGWVVMTLLLVLGILGALGGAGPLSFTTVHEDTLTTDYYRFGRLLTPSDIQLRIDGSAVTSDQVQVRIDLSLLDHNHIDSIQPEPQSVQGASDSLIYTFQATPNQPLTIRFFFQPERIGTHAGHMGLENGPSVEVSQFVFP